MFCVGSGNPILQEHNPIQLSLAYFFRCGLVDFYCFGFGSVSSCVSTIASQVWFDPISQNKVKNIVSYEKLFYFNMNKYVYVSFSYIRGFKPASLQCTNPRTLADSRVANLLIIDTLVETRCNLPQ